MQYIFNSLGSNYSFRFALKALIYGLYLPKKERITSALDHKIESLFPDFTNGPFYFYKGRDAIEFTLKSLAIGEGDKVITQAFTCHAIEAAIRRAGAQPVFVDIEKSSLNPTVKTISEAYKKNANVKAVLIQHTLGTPAEIKEIQLWCAKNSVYLIEDLAQALGGTNEENQLLGSKADALIFSFGRDKIIDAVTGGACYIKEKNSNTQTENFKNLTAKIFLTDSVYPLITYLVRKTYPIVLGKIILYFAKAIQLIQSPVKARFDFITALPVSNAALAVTHFQNLKLQIEHRRSIAMIYYKSLRNLSLLSEAQIAHASNLRFSIFVDDPKSLIKHLSRQHMYIEDRWYRSAVDSGSLHYPSKYVSGSCPVAENLAKHIVNLPTHREISSEEAQHIAIVIQEFYKGKNAT